MKLMAVLVFVLWVWTASAQEAREYEVMASFEEATSLSIDLRGRIFVTDRGQEAVLQLSQTGVETGRLGGPGERDGEFDELSDIDPGTGLSWLIADTGNGRLQRFSQSFLHMESLVVPQDADYEPGMATRLEPRIDIYSSGRPIAVAQSPSGEIFAIEESERLVLKWDKSRRIERAIGGFGAGEGALNDPVALEADGEQIYVADRGLASVVVYDLFGGFVQRFGTGTDQVEALTLTDNEVWIISSSTIEVYTTSGDLLRTIRSPGELTVIDAAPYGDYLFLLTRTQLVRLPSHN